MILNLQVDFDFDGIENLDLEEVKGALETVLDSGAETTNTSLTLSKLCYAGEGK